MNYVRCISLIAFVALMVTFVHSEGKSSAFIHIALWCETKAYCILFSHRLHRRERGVLQLCIPVPPKLHQSWANVELHGCVRFGMLLPTGLLSPGGQCLREAMAML